MRVASPAPGGLMHDPTEYFRSAGGAAPDSPLPLGRRAHCAGGSARARAATLALGTT
jgi:hypothetical protein